MYWVLSEFVNDSFVVKFISKLCPNLSQSPLGVKGSKTVVLELDNTRCVKFRGLFCDPHPHPPIFCPKKSRFLHLQKPLGS